MSDDNAQTIVPDAPATPGVASDVGDTFGDYELIDEIARGGMGVVFKARHRKLDRVVALKMILGGRFSSADDIQRFQMEAASAARLDHSGIISVYDIGEHDGQAFFAMKYVEGGSLGDHIERLRNDPEAAARLIIEVARSVHHGHQRGILHRDLKPANILIDEAGNPLVTDYGLAKSTGDESNITKTGAVVGTPSYMSPEQAGGSDNLTTATDVYAIGAILYELLTGRPPHKKASPVKTVMSVINDTPDTPSSVNRAVDRDLELICLKCIERAPEDRYATAAAIADDLEAWLNGGRLSVQPPSAVAVARRWLRANKNFAYSAAAMFFGVMICLPFLFGFFNSDAGSLAAYDYFPEAERPWFEPLTKLPRWADDVSIALLAFIFWPSLGLWNAMVTRPKTVRRAVGVGALTSGLLLVFAFIALGWIIVLTASNRYSGPVVKTLGDAVWAGETDTEAARAAADRIYAGLEDVPEDVRARVVADRMFNDQIGAAMLALIVAVGIGAAFCIPIVTGTVIAMMLLDRGYGFFMLRFRYGVAWLASTAILVIVGGYAFAAVIGKLNPMFIYYHIAICVAGAVLLWMSLRQWRKPADNADFEPTLLVSPESNG